MSAADVIAEYHSGTRLVANLREGNGNALSGEMVSFTVNGKKWEFATNANGVVRFSTDRFGVGNYSVLISYDGDELYYPSSTTANIIIHDNTVLTAADVIADYHSGTRLVAPLKDGNGNALSNEKVSFTVNGKKWEFTTNVNGVVRFSTDRFDVGNYTVLISYDGNEFYYPSSTTANIVII